MSYESCLPACDGGDLFYATNASGSWVTEVVDSYALGGSESDIAIGPSDNPHISYKGAIIPIGGDKLMYTTKQVEACP